MSLKTPQRPQSKQRLLLSAIIVFSLLFHLILLFFLNRSFKNLSHTNLETQKNKIWVEPIDWLSQKTIAPIEKPEKEEEPDDAKRFGEWNSRVEEEMSVVQPLLEAPTASPPPLEAKPQENADPRPKQKLKKNNQTTQKIETPSRKPQELSNKQQTKKDPVKPNKIEQKTQITDLESPKKEDPQTSSQEQNLNNFVALKPRDPLALHANDLNGMTGFKNQQKLSEQDLNERIDRQINGLNFGSAALPDYKIGNKTYLNVMKLQDSSFFTRLIQTLKLRWNPRSVVYNYLRKTGARPAQIRGVLGLEIDDSGSLDRVFVIQTSKVDGYDAEALQTVRESFPFSKPPEKFLKEGKLYLNINFIVLF